MVTPAFYAMRWKWQAHAIRDELCVVSKSIYTVFTRAGNGCQRR